MIIYIVFIYYLVITYTLFIYNNKVTPKDKIKIHQMMKLAVRRLHAVDILLYFAYAMKLIELNQILNPPKRDKVTNEMDVEAYKKYREQKDEECGVGKYVHHFVEYWIRVLKFPDGRLEEDVLPAASSPITLIT